MPIGINFNLQQTVVLVIEDSPTQALHTSDLLERSGIQTICATNGRMGLSLARSVHPALIVLDVQMPDMNGFEVCSKLKADPETSEIPVIMLTRNDTVEAAEMGLQSGADDYIPKDAFADAVLIETLRQMGFLAR
jgi:CheY-like chemotaxis protein